ncbi:MAG: hypothetical protein II304_10610 [Bacteroidales bacterium]|nr:hypothetical protein [Bacteroidales bacterium]
MTCKECVHSEICLKQYEGLNQEMMFRECKKFKDKNRFVEVKQGYWKTTKEPLGANEVDCVECSVCGESWIIDEDLDCEDQTEYWHYCMNCGAKMGERKEEKQ